MLLTIQQELHKLPFVATTFPSLQGALGLTHRKDAFAFTNLPFDLVAIGLQTIQFLFIHPIPVQLLFSSSFFFFFFLSLWRAGARGCRVRERPRRQRRRRQRGDAAGGIGAASEVGQNTSRGGVTNCL
jgi:hypothetical protein